MEVSEQDVPALEQRDFRRLRLLDLHDHVGRLEDGCGIRKDLRAGFLVGAVGAIDPVPGLCFDEQLVAMSDELGDRSRREAHAIFVDLDLFWHPNAHLIVCSARDVCAGLLTRFSLLSRAIAGPKRQCYGATSVTEDLARGAGDASSQSVGSESQHMNITATGGAVAEAPLETAHGHGHAQGPLYKLAIGAIGIVFGDIGTSPIYSFRETFAGHHPLSPDRFHIYAVLSMIFWSMMIVVTLKYVMIIMRADNKGEGGSLALLALINRTISGKKKWANSIVMLGVFATALFYGDSMITPAISVLSAVEGLTTVNSSLGPFVVPIAIGILVGLFAIQARGTARVGMMFGPVMLFYFGSIAVLGVIHIMDQPNVALAMINPANAAAFFVEEPLRAFLAMGSVVLALTGA